MSSILKVDTINEVTSANGVTVDGLSIKDSKLVTADSVVTANITNSNITVGKMAANSVDSDQYVDGSIDTIHIADDQITLAKMAPGTDGNIISYDASGNPVAIATGNDGQVLTSTGAGSPPAFETLASATNTPAFFAFNGANQTLNDAALTKIVFNLEKFDTDNAFASNTFTVPSGQAGKYLFSWQVDYFNSGNKILEGIYNIKVNNSILIQGWEATPSAYSEQTKQGSTIISLSAADTVDFYFYINTNDSSQSTIRSGGSTEVHSFFSGFKLIE